MKNNLSIVLNCLSLLLILEATNFFNNLLLFIIAGAIPGTSLSISPIVMLLLMLVIGFAIGRRILRVLPLEQTVTERTMPRKRYAQL